MELATIYGQKKEHENELKYLDMATQADPTNANYPYKAALVQFQNGNLDEAVMFLNACIKADDKFAFA